MRDSLGLGSYWVPPGFLELPGDCAVAMNISTLGLVFQDHFGKEPVLPQP